MLDADTLLRWSGYKHVAQRALLRLCSLSMRSLENGGDGWTDLMSRTDVLEQCGISRSQYKDVIPIIELEFDKGLRQGAKVCYRFKGIGSNFDHISSAEGETGSKSDHSGAGDDMNTGSNFDHKNGSTNENGSNFDHLPPLPSPAEIQAILHEASAIVAGTVQEGSSFDHVSGEAKQNGSKSDHKPGDGSNFDQVEEKPCALKVFKDSNTQLSDQDDQQTVSESGNLEPIAETETDAPHPGQPAWMAMGVNEIKDEFRHGRLVPQDLRDIRAHEFELPKCPPDSRARTRPDGTPYQRKSLIEWIDRVLDGSEKVDFAKDLELAWIIAMYSFDWRGTIDEFEAQIKTNFGQKIMGFVRVVVQEKPRPTPDTLKKSYGWYFTEKYQKFGQHMPAHGDTIADMHRRYITWKEDQGFGLCIDCGELHQNGQFAYCDNCGDDYEEAGGDFTTKEVEPAEALAVPIAWLESLAYKPQGDLSIADCWQAVLGQLELQTNKPTFDTWVCDAEAIRYSDGVLAVSVRNNMQKQWLEKHLARSIDRLMKDISGALIAVEFVLLEEILSEVETA